MLKRPEHRIVTGMSGEDVEAFLAAFASAAEGVDVHFRWRPQLRDPKDELVLEVAANGHADALVTHNAGTFFRRQVCLVLRVLLPREVPKELESES